MATPDAFVPVAITTRSGFDESVHFGAVVGARSRRSDRAAPSAIRRRRSTRDRRTSRCRRWRWCAPGCSCRPSCWRWCAPATTARRRTSTACASILATAGLDERSLANTPDLPLDADVGRGGAARRRTPHRAADELQRQAQRHAGDQRAINGWPIDAGYLDADHPLQQQITAHDRRAGRRAAPPHRCRRLRVAGPRDTR